MDLLQQLFAESSAVDAVPVVDVFLAASVSFLLSLVIGYTYRVTHLGPSYSQTTVQTMVIMSVVVSLIMLIIGTNLARAFSLVGALSIIRFRNAVKESRDVAFYFLAMAVGMATGTRHIWAAVVFTFLMCSMVYFMTRFQIGAKPMVEILLKMRVDESIDYQTVFNEIFYRFLESSDLLSVDSDGSGQLELIYTVTLRKRVREQELMSELQMVDGSVRPQIIHGHSGVSL